MSGGEDQRQDKDSNESGGNYPSSSRAGDHGNWGDDGATMPVEINIPGRTFPVQEFFLEDVLSMTGFVSEAHPEAPDMAQIESDLLSLLGGAPQSTSSSGKKNGVASGPVSQSMPWAEGTLSCVMCGQSRFKCAEELGTHIALCDGGGGLSMLELENRVRSVDATLETVEEFINGNSDDDKEFLDDIMENDL